MLIFNCTEAASTFFSRIHKGKKITPVAMPATPIIENDEPNPLTEQWLVHAITVQRKHVLFVIHVRTRYCMIFADAKKSDVKGFVAWFTERWREGLTQDAMRHNFIQWVDPGIMFDRHEEGCKDYAFYRRGHRSAQKHIDEIVWIFEDFAAERGCLPQGEYAAMDFDAQMNYVPRSSKNQKDYFWPDEQMIAHWLRQYCAVNDAEVQNALKRRKEARREIRAFVESSNVS